MIPFKSLAAGSLATEDEAMLIPIADEGPFRELGLEGVEVQYMHLCGLLGIACEPGGDIRLDLRKMKEEMYYLKYLALRIASEEKGLQNAFQAGGIVAVSPNQLTFERSEGMDIIRVRDTPFTAFLVKDFYIWAVIFLRNVYRIVGKILLGKRFKEEKEYEENKKWLRQVLKRRNFWRTLQLIEANAEWIGDLWANRGRIEHDDTFRFDEAELIAREGVLTSLVPIRLVNGCLAAEFAHTTFERLYCFWVNLVGCLVQDASDMRQSSMGG